MCIELRKTCHSIAVSSSVITNFHFNSTPNEIQSEPTRFNNYFINYKSQSTFAEDQIRALKGSCSKINSHILKYKKEKNKKSILSFFNLKDPKKEAELFDRLEKIHDDETDFHSNVFLMAISITEAIADVNKALITNHTLDYNRIPDAAKLLNNYSFHFGNLEKLAIQTRNEIENTIDLLES